jgi:hypothetical protein
MLSAILGLAALVLLFLGLAFVTRQGEMHKFLDAIFAFIAFFFLLLGLCVMTGRSNDSSILMGDPFASLGLTYFWVAIRKSR